jgi:hypothetical protein
VTAVPRPKTVYTDEQQALLDAAVEKAQTAERAEDEAWEAIKKARDARVLDTDLTDERTPPRFNRATLNRRYGKRPT